MSTDTFMQKMQSYTCRVELKKLPTHKCKPRQFLLRFLKLQQNGQCKDRNVEGKLKENTSTSHSPSASLYLLFPFNLAFHSLEGFNALSQN